MDVEVMNRIARLEKQSRRQRILLAVVALCAVVFALIPAVSADQKVDPKSFDGRVFAIYDKDGVLRGGWAALKDEVGMVFTDAKGKERMRLTESGLDFFGEKQKQLFIRSDGIGISDSTGKTTFSVLSEVGKEKQTALSFEGKDGSVQLSHNGLSLSDQNDKPRAILLRGFLMFMDDKKNPIWKEP